MDLNQYMRQEQTIFNRMLLFGKASLITAVNTCAIIF